MLSRVDSMGSVASATSMDGRDVSAVSVTAADATVTSTRVSGGSEVDATVVSTTGSVGSVVDATKVSPTISVVVVSVTTVVSEVAGASSADAGISGSIKIEQTRSPAAMN